MPVKNKKISLILPVYQEEEVIHKFHSELCKVLKIMKHFSFEVIYIDDGSTDKTPEIIHEINNEHNNSDPDIRIILIILSRNFGHQYAISCGIDYCTGEAAIIMDSDLQHPPELIPVLIEKWLEGYDNVYTIRNNPLGESKYKYFISSTFYKFVNLFSDIHIHENVADFRLISKSIITIFKEDIRERTRFLRGLSIWVGFDSIGVEYSLQPRAGGVSKYSFKKMISLALSGITSFSTTPLVLGVYLGFFGVFICLMYAIYALIMLFYAKTAIPGWTSLLLIMIFIASIQFILIGILGIYIGHIFTESKYRPLYIVKKIVHVK